MERAARPKPEHMTHLNAKMLVRKDHPRIAFRGFIDLMEAEILLAQTQISLLKEPRYQRVIADLGELLNFVRGLIRADVLGESVGFQGLCGYSADDLREHSHHPEKYYGQPHFMPAVTDDPAIIFLNHVRAVVRQAELAGYRAFKDYDGSVTRPDIILAMNRLSSLLWIMMIKLKAGKYEHNL